MKRFLASVCAVLLLSPSIFGVSKWGPIAEKLDNAIVFVEIYEGTNLQGSCTGFRINEEKKYILTASHCDGEKMLVDGTQAFKVFKDDRKDLLVLRASQSEGPSLKLASADPERGDEVASMGFGEGLEDPMFRIAHISNVRMDIEGLSGPFTMIDAGFIPGQSGGPVVNEKGEVVMIIQRSNASLGIGVGAEMIKDKVGKYFGENK